MTTHQDPTDPAPFSDEELDQLEPGWLNRCEWCGWPLGPREKGCAEGDCSQRPRPSNPMSRWKETVRRLLSGYRALREENERLRREVAEWHSEVARFNRGWERRAEPYENLEDEFEQMGHAWANYDSVRAENKELRAEIEELRNRLLEEHEGNHGRVEAKRWEECAIDKETEALLAKERLKEARDENERLRAKLAGLCNRFVCSHPVGMTCIACDARALLEDSAK